MGLDFSERSFLSRELNKTNKLYLYLLRLKQKYLQEHTVICNLIIVSNEFSTLNVELLCPINVPFVSVVPVETCDVVSSLLESLEKRWRTITTET